MNGSRRGLAFDLTCGLIATAAVGCASFVDLVALDRRGAALILIGTASLLAVLMRGVRKKTSS